MAMGWENQGEISFTTHKVKSGKTTQSVSSLSLSLLSVGDYRRKFISLETHKFLSIT